MSSEITVSELHGSRKKEKEEEQRRRPVTEETMAGSHSLPSESGYMQELVGDRGGGFMMEGGMFGDGGDAR